MMTILLRSGNWISARSLAFHYFIFTQDLRPGLIIWRPCGTHI